MEALPIICRLINTCWFVFKWAFLLTLTTVLVVGGYVYLRLDDELRRYAEHVLSEHYAGLDVELAAARFDPGRGVTLSNLVLRQPLADGNFAPLAEVGELQLLGPFDVESLLSGRAAVEQIRIKSPRLHVTQDASGKWNVASLFPPPSSGDEPPDVDIVGAVVTLRVPRGTQRRSLTLREIDLNVTCQSSASRRNNNGSSPRYRIEGTIGDDLAETLTLEGQFDTADGAWTAAANVAELNLASPVVQSLLELLPTDRRLISTTELAGKATVQVDIEQPAGGTVKWNADFQVSDARISAEALPRPVSSIAVRGTANQARLHVTEARGRFGKANLVLALVRHGWHADAPLAMQARAERLTIDRGLADALPAPLQKVWDRFRPVGQVTATLAARRHHGRWLPEVTVQCHDVAFEDREKFAYRVHRGQGTVRMVATGEQSGSTVHVDLKALADGTPVTIRGRFSGLPGAEVLDRPVDREPATGWLTVEGNNVAVTKELTAALPDKAARVVDALAVEGRFSLRWLFERTAPHATPHTETDLTFHNCRVKYEDFPYPITHVTGTARERDGTWHFENLASRDPTSPKQIQARGTCIERPDGHHLQLLVTGTQVPLDDTLRQVLSPAAQQTWDAVRPRSGQISFRADVRHHLGAATEPEVQLEVVPEPEVVSIQPASFPYRLNGLTGKIVIHNGQVTFHRLQARHGATLVETDGTWTRNPSGGWQLDFHNLHIDRLAANYDLKMAAPQAVNQVLENLQPTGTFSVHDGTIRFSQDTATDTQVRAEWRLSVGCQQNDLVVGIPLKSVSGIVHLSGRHEGDLQFAAGQLDLDSAFYNGLQLTSIRGPLWIDGEQFRLGRGATLRMNEVLQRSDPLRKAEANLYGGRLALDATVPLRARAKYVVEGSLDACDLARVATEYFGGSLELSGNLSGHVALTGMGNSLDLLEGGGRLTVRDADMYELPVMARLLKVLRNRVPDKTAFTGVDAEFKLAGTTVHFDQLDLLGDVVNLYGEGEATFDRHLDLQFHSTVGRNDFAVPLLRSMIGQASANLLLIKVTGTLDNAEVVRQPLPAVNEFMEQLQGGSVARPPAAPSGFWQR